MKTLLSHFPSSSRRNAFHAVTNGKTNQFHTLTYQEIFPEKLSLRSQQHLKRIAESFILFDWEFFENELEYE